MARPSEHSLGYEALNFAPSIYGAEASAEWKRNRRGEVTMTVRMPMMQLTLKSTSKLQEATQVSKWMHGLHPPG